MLRNWFPKPRWKTYASQSGFVYQYVFEGVRGDDTYVFRATSGPQIDVALEVILKAEVLATWTRDHRELTEMERYGIAKMSLMQALDQSPLPRAIHPTAEEVAAICRELDL